MFGQLVSLREDTSWIPSVLLLTPTRGATSNLTVNNFISSSGLEVLKMWYPFFRENDLAIGVALNVFGRKVVLTDCDEYTKEYYRTTYGIETFDTILTPDDNNLIVSKEKEIPPWNGYGSYEDSEGNCKKVMPVAPKKDIFKFLSKGR